MRTQVLWLIISSNSVKQVPLLQSEHVLKTN